MSPLNSQLQNYITVGERIGSKYLGNYTITMSPLNSRGEKGYY